ncbi:MAG: FKBP-type peptidyl-prolyl cis-trans isomerase [Bifidobacteriaceae bacterium]|jgi:peptidylprolyl isomerase|nr:FKBP-type peptidyl-prolyl cis-trans isomerase [Bifidobacteriaceae bacterium]
MANILDYIEVDKNFAAAPDIIIKKSKHPKEFSVFELTTGDGSVVTAGSTIEVNYHGQIWQRLEVFDSSFYNEETVKFPIGVGSVIKGWDKGLIGKTVGSRILLIIPPNYGYGKNGMMQAGIFPEDVLVFIVDIVSVKK